MATQIVVRGQHVAPSAYKITGLNPFTPSVATAQWDGSGASGDFFPCMSFYSQDGQLLARMGVEAAVTAGDSAQVTYGPFLRQAGGGDGIKYDVENVGGYLHVEADDGTHGLGNIVFFAPDGEFLVTTDNTPGVGEIDLNSAQISLRGSNGLFQVNDDGSASWSGDAGLSVSFNDVTMDAHTHDIDVTVAGGTITWRDHNGAAKWQWTEGTTVLHGPTGGSIVFDL